MVGGPLGDQPVQALADCGVDDLIQLRPDIRPLAVADCLKQQLGASGCPSNASPSTSKTLPW